MTDTYPDLTITAAERKPSRRFAREIALKVAYAMEIRSCEYEEVLNDPLINDGELPPGYTVRLLTHVERYREHLDEIIRLKVEKWEFHRIAILDRIILRMATTELMYFPDVPPKVSINEAIEIAKTYSTSKSGKFVNGILDAIFNDLSKGRLDINGGNSTSS